MGYRMPRTLSSASCRDAISASSSCGSKTLCATTAKFGNQTSCEELAPLGTNFQNLPAIQNTTISTDLVE